MKKENVANCFKHCDFDLERQNSEELDVLRDVNLPGPMTREELEDIPSDLSVLDALKVVRNYAQHNVLNNAIFSIREIETHLTVAVQTKIKTMLAITVSQY